MQSLNSNGDRAYGRRFVGLMVLFRLLFPVALATLLYYAPLGASAAQRPVVAIIAFAAGVIVALVVPSFWRRRPAK